MALGRGLGEILSEVEEAYEKDLSNINSFELEAQGARIEELPVEKISPNPFQPRKHFDEVALKELSHSIQTHGLLQPIIVIEKEDGYLLVAGERRLRAHKLAQLSSIKSIIVNVEIDDFRMRELALIENIQRENLNAIELANSYAELIEVHKITHDELADIVYKSRSQITNTIRLLTLSEYAKRQIAEGRISQGHAKVLVGLDEKRQKTIVDSIIGQKLSVRDVEKIVKQNKNREDLKKDIKRPLSLLDEYTNEIDMHLLFKHKNKAKSIEIYFENTQEVENFLAFLKNRS
ncbi:MAG: ParB/RepB/Spo0J family partition protein [Sulfurovum sp.]|nr:ParB/RepB/Spo0J family partition protein [Sulfurovum sp.]MCB4761400.1 ParB/RepB/Spo0J family partition protein [Sulfurovum sp.]